MTSALDARWWLLGVVAAAGIAVGWGASYAVLLFDDMSTYGPGTELIFRSVVLPIGPAIALAMLAAVTRRAPREERTAPHVTVAAIGFLCFFLVMQSTEGLQSAERRAELLARDTGHLLQR